MNTTYYLNPGELTTIVADANVANGFYQILGNPGEPNQTAVALLAGTTKQLGPYNVGKYLKLMSSLGNITHSEEFGGFAFSDDVEGDNQAGSSPIASVSANESQGIWKRTLLTLTAAPVVITDDPGVIQFGGVKIYDFPEGLLDIQGAVVKGNLTAGVTGTIIDAFTGLVSLGTTTAITGATLVTTQADVLPSTALTQAVAKVAAVQAVSTAAAQTESGARWLDGTATAKDLYLNFKVTDNATHTAGTASFTGTVEFIWSILGDA